MSIEAQLREGLRRPADISQMPPDTVDQVLRTARRQRHRRRAGTVLGVVALAAAILTPTVALRRHGQPVAAAPGEFVVASYTVYGSSGPDYRLLDRATGNYVPAPTVEGKATSEPLPSPDGRQVIFRITGDDAHLYLAPTAAFVAGRITHPAAVPNHGSPGTRSYQWSADGKRLLEPYPPTKAKPRSGFATYEVATHKLGPLVVLPVDDTVLAWGRSSTEVAAHADLAEASERLDTVRFYSLTGQSRGQVALHTARFTFPFLTNNEMSPSPTGRYIGLGKDAVYDLRTRHALPQPKLPHCSSVVYQVGWSSDDSYLLECLSAPTLYQVNVDGRILRTVKLPLGTPRMPTTISGKMSALVTLNGIAGYPGRIGIRP